MRDLRNDPSPCLSCNRVRNPENCENKRCNYWQAWFLRRWALIHSYPRRMHERPCGDRPGVSVGGNRYMPPHQVREYLVSDPCGSCRSTRDLCGQPCRVRRTWTEEREILQ